MNWTDYAYTNDGGGMIVLLLILGAILIYLLFSKGFWLDKWCRRNNWDGSDIQGEAPFKVQEKVPFTPSLDKPFDDPEVPNRPSKKKRAKPRKTKRKYTKRSKK